MKPLVKAISSQKYFEKLFGIDFAGQEFTPVPTNGSLVNHEGTPSIYGYPAHPLSRHAIIPEELRDNMPYLKRETLKIAQIEDVRARVEETGKPLSATYSIEAQNTFTAIALETSRDDIQKLLAAGEQRIILYTEFPNSVGFGFTPEYHDGKQLVESRHIRTVIDAPRPGASFSEIIVVSSYPDLATTKRGNAYVPYPPQKEFNTLVNDTGDAFSLWPPPGTRIAASATSTIESSLTQIKADAAVYGRIPGGIIMASHAVSLPKISSLALDDSFDPSEVTLVINGSLRFATGISLDELSILYHSVFVSGEGLVRMGATSTAETFGTDEANVVGLTFRLADQRLGELVFGAASNGESLATSRHPDYRNPIRAQAAVAEQSDPELYRRLATGIASPLTRYIFLDFAEVAFAQTSDNTIERERITVRLSPVVAQGSQKAPEYVGGAEYFQKDNAEEFAAIEHLRKEIGFYLETEPFFGRCALYSSVLALLRSARRSGAEIDDGALLQESYDNRLALVSKDRDSSVAVNSEVAALYLKASSAILAQLSSSSLSSADVLHRAIVGFLFATRANSREQKDAFSSRLDSILSGAPSYSVDPKVVEHAFSAAAGSMSGEWVRYERSAHAYLTRSPRELVESALTILANADARYVIAVHAAHTLGAKLFEAGMPNHALQLFAYGTLRGNISIDIISSEMSEIAQTKVTPGTVAIWAASLVARQDAMRSGPEIVARHIGRLLEDPDLRWGLRQGMRGLDQLEVLLPNVNMSKVKSGLETLVNGLEPRLKPQTIG